MLFLFKYVDELVGKGLEWNTIAELLMYAAASNVPLALPLAILLSSIMTFGNLGEQYELVAIKASGISLARAMMPLVIVMVFMSIAAFYFSNIVMPKSFLKMASLLYDVREKKAAFAIPEGVFYNDLDGYSIRVDKKDKDGQTLHGIMIYDHSQGMGNTNVILAKQGKMYKSDDNHYLIFNLSDGVRYEEMRGTGNLAERQRHVRIRFSQFEQKFDMSGFNLSRTKEELFKDQYQMLNVKQLLVKEDSLKKVESTKIKVMQSYLQTTFLFYRKSAALKKAKAYNLKLKPSDDVLNALPSDKRLMITEDALSSMRNVKSYLSTAVDEKKSTDDLLRRHLVEFHRKFTLSFACMVLFFIGAPMGAIVRKGGLGMPFLISIIFFLVFHIFSITGEKFAKQGSLEPYQGMWMASVVLVPLGLFLTYKAATDSALFDVDKYQRFFNSLFARKRNLNK